MFDKTTGAEVIIRPFDQGKAPYTEYEAPSTSDLYAGGKSERWIEAVEGERFVIEVKLHPVFNFRGAKQVQIEYDLGVGDYFIHRIDKPTNRRNRILSHGLHSYSDVIGGQNVECGLVFKELEIVDDATYRSDEEENDEISSRGQIVVALTRGQERDPGTPEELEKASGKLRPRPYTTSDNKTTKRVALENGRSHEINPAILEASDMDACYSPPFQPHKRHGEPIVFTFYYTSRMFLEMRNIVPTGAQPQGVETSSMGTHTSDSVPRSPDAARRVKTEPLGGSNVIKIGSDDENALPAANASRRPSNGTALDEANKRGRSEGTGDGDKAAKKARLMRRLEILKIEEELAQLDDQA